jgi:hypothetical protein
MTDDPELSMNAKGIFQKVDNIQQGNGGQTFTFRATGVRPSLLGLPFPGAGEVYRSSLLA